MATKKNQKLTEDVEFLQKSSKILLEQAMESNKETISKAISDSLVDDESEGSEFGMDELEGSMEGDENLEGSNEESEDMEDEISDEESGIEDEMSEEGDEKGEEEGMEDDEEDDEFEGEEMEDEESEEETEELKESKIIDLRKASPRMLKEAWNKMSEEDEFEVVKEDDYDFDEFDFDFNENEDEEMDSTYTKSDKFDIQSLDSMEDDEDLDEQVETGYGKMHKDEEMGEFEKMFFDKEEDFSDEDMDLDEEMIHELGRSYANLRNQRADQFNTPAKKYSAHRFRPAVRESKEYKALQEKFMTLKEENAILKERLEKSKQAILETQDNLQKVSRLTALAHYAKELFYEHTTSKKERAYIIESLESAQTLEDAKEVYKKLNEEFTHKALMTENKKVGGDVLKEAEELLVKESGSTSSSGLVKETTVYEEKTNRMMELINYKVKK